MIPVTLRLFRERILHTLLTRYDTARFLEGIQGIYSSPPCMSV
jgi:hypothetical protein